MLAAETPLDGKEALPGGAAFPACCNSRTAATLKGAENELCRPEMRDPNARLTIARGSFGATKQKSAGRPALWPDGALGGCRGQRGPRLRPGGC